MTCRERFLKEKRVILVMAPHAGMEPSPLQRSRKRRFFGWLKEHNPVKNTRDPALELIARNAGSWRHYQVNEGQTMRWQNHPLFRKNYYSPELHNTGRGNSFDAMALFNSLGGSHGGEHEGEQGHAGGQVLAEPHGHAGRGHEPRIDPQIVQKIYTAKRLEEHMLSLVEKINKEILVPLNTGKEYHPGVEPVFTWASGGPVRTGIGGMISGSKPIFKRMRGPANTTKLKLLQLIPGASLFGAASGDAILSSFFNAVARPFRRERVGDALQRDAGPLLQEFERAKSEYESAVSQISPAEIKLFGKAMENFFGEQKRKARAPQDH